MNDRARMLFGLAIVLGLAAAGAFFYARFDMENRIRGYSGAIDGIGYSRGGAIPTEQEFTTQARAAAEPLGLELVSFEVTRSERTGRDGVGNLMQDSMGDTANIRMQLVTYDVRASVVATKWIFSRSGELAVDRTYRKEVRLEAAPPRPPPPAIRDEPELPRGL